MSATPAAPGRARLSRLLDASDGIGVGPALPGRSLLFDVLIALVFTAVGFLLLQVFSPKASWDDALFVALINLPLALRRRLPVTSFGLIFVLGLLQMMAGVPIGLYDAGLLFSLYSVVGYTDRRFALVALSVATVAVLVGAATDWWGYVDRQLAAPSTSVRLLSSFGAAGLVAITWALGERLRSGRAGVIALSARADQLERDREQQAIIAAAGERARIAREMHDVIAHGLSVMVVQADGAAYVVEQSPATGRAVLEQIAATGRESLAQMRDLLGLLRADGDDLTLASAEHDDGGPTHVPQPALDDIPELVAEASAAGADVTLTDTGDSGAVPPMVQLTAYRVVQEALTNARKHGGRAVEVTMDHSTSGLRVIIRNGPPDLGGPAVTGPPGHGLVGMAERVAAVGGDLHTRAVQDGGFVVDAWLPFRGEGPLHE